MMILQRGKVIKATINIDHMIRSGHEEGGREEEEKDRSKLLLLLISLSLLNVQNVTGKRPGKQTKKDQPRRARSIYGDGHLEEIERFYSQEGRSEQRVSGEKSLEVPKEENADSKEEKKPFVFH